MAKKSIKGGNFEREISKYLSFWWSNGDRNDLMWHTHSSGGRATERAKSGLKTAYQYGDLCPTHPDAYPLFDLFLFELKRGYTKDIEILGFVDKLNNRKPPVIWEWWNKAEREKNLAGRDFTLLIIKRDSHRKFIIFNEELLEEIEERTNLECYFPKFSTFAYNDQVFIVTLLSDFFDAIDKELIMEMWNDRHS